jgi:SAM-dependent methyltransferase
MSDTPTQRTVKHRWEREYELQVLPTSRSTAPSRAMEHWCRFLEGRGRPHSRRVLDIACGTGRNSLYLAHKGAVLCAMDIAENALRILREHAVSEGVQDQVTPVCAAMDHTLPFASGTFDYALCLTALENLLTAKHVSFFISELHRVLKGGALVLLYRLCENDEFYERRLIIGSDNRMLAFSEDLGVWQRIFSLGELSQILAPSFQIVESQSFEFADTRGNYTYHRSLQSLVLARS